MVRALNTYFADTARSHRLGSGGRYERIQPSGRRKPVDAQEVFNSYAESRAQRTDEALRRHFRVRRTPLKQTP